MELDFCAGSIIEPGSALGLIEPPSSDTPSLRRQCQLLGISRSSLYYQRRELLAENLLELMRLIDEQYLRTPVYGSRRMTVHLNRCGHRINRKRVRRLMRQIGLQAVYPRPRTSLPGKGHRIYPQPAAEADHQSAEPGLGDGCQLYPAGSRVHIPGGRDELAQPPRAVLAGLQHPGYGFLRRGLG